MSRPPKKLPREWWKQKSKEQVRRSVAGTKAKAAGRKFESEIECSLMYHRDRGVAVMTRSHPPVAGPPGRMFICGKGAVDFVGLFDGVPTAFDAKSTGAIPMTWRVPDRDIHEARFLRDWKRQNGIAFFLIRAGNIAVVVSDVEALADGHSIALRDKTKKGVEPNYLVPVIHARMQGADAFWPIEDAVRKCNG